MTKSRKINEIINHLCSNHGWTVKRGGKHIKLYNPENRLVTISASASDYRAELNIIKDIKRYGGAV